MICTICSGFIEKSLWLIPLAPRDSKYDVLADTDINEKKARALALAADECWKAINAQDIDAWGKACTASFEAQTAMFPNMISPHVEKAINEYKDHVKGYKITGAGGGGYLVIINDEPIKNAIQIYAIVTIIVVICASVPTKKFVRIVETATSAGTGNKP